MRRDIEKLIAYYVRKFDTRNPFEIANSLGILYQIGDIGCSGCYMFLKNHRYIFLNQNLSKHEMLLVMAHELGHAILHRKENCYFIKNKTLLLNSKNEIEANTFAAMLLISDDIITENSNCTTEQLSRLLGYEQNLIELRLKSYREAQTPKQGG